MALYRSNEDIEIQRESCLLVNTTIAEIAKLLKPGITTLSLDPIAETLIRDNGGIPACKGYHGFPFTLCISMNDAVVHGFPNSYVLKEGDLITIDTVVKKNGFHGDSAYTFIIGETTPETLNLVKVTKESLYIGIAQATTSNRVGDIGYAIEQHTYGKHGYGVVREMVGHGVGLKMHEDPNIPNYGRRGSGKRLQENLVIAIEPMITLAGRDIYTGDDGWTILTEDESPAVHFEHNVCIQKGAPKILTDFTDIELAEKANSNLNSSYYTLESQAV